MSGEVFRVIRSDDWAEFLRNREDVPFVYKVRASQCVEAVRRVDALGASTEETPNQAVASVLRGEGGDG